MPVSNDMHEWKIFIKQDGKPFATSLFLVLVLIEITDWIFSTDSIRVILTTTQEHFIVHTSNVYAIHGLRSPYFPLARMMNKFWYLWKGLAFKLIFVGLKMLVIDFCKLPIQIALLVIVINLILSIATSLISSRRI